MDKKVLISINCDLGFFGGCGYSPLLVTTKFCQNAKVAIRGFKREIEIGLFFSQIRAQKWHCDLCDLFCDFQLARGNKKYE